MTQIRHCIDHRDTAPLISAVLPCSIGVTSCSAAEDAGKGLHALAELGRGVVLEQHQGRSVPAGELGPDAPGGLGDGRRPGPVSVTTARGSGSSRPDTRVGHTFPGRSGRGVAPERVGGDQMPSGGRSESEAGVSMGRLAALAERPQLVISGSVILM